MDANVDMSDPSTASDASCAPQPRANKCYPRTGKRGAPQAFPRKVFEILSEQPAEIISWTPSGLAFVIHDMPRFVSEVLQKYFAHQKFSSFQRQLNLYGYRRIEPGGDEPAGSYYHPSFRQDGEDLVGEVRRTPQSHRGRGGGRDSGRDQAVKLIAIQEPGFSRFARCLLTIETAHLAATS